MNEMLFILPLALLPGVATLIISTAARFGLLHDEVHRLLDHQQGGRAEDLRTRAHYFHRALIAMYLCVAFFALASLFGIAMELLGATQPWIIIAVTAVGCVALLYAAYQLFRESLLAMGRINRHLDALAQSQGGTNDG